MLDFFREENYNVTVFGLHEAVLSVLKHLLQNLDQHQSFYNFFVMRASCPQVCGLHAFFIRAA